MWSLHRRLIIEILKDLCQKLRLNFWQKKIYKKAKLAVIEHKLIGKSAYLEEERHVKVIRCYNCYMIGHISRICTQTTRCGICASKGHTELDCTHPNKCTNCDGYHTASSTISPVYQQVFQVQRTLFYSNSRTILQTWDYYLWIAKSWTIAKSSVNSLASNYNLDILCLWGKIR